jgi:transcriptional regulator with GAF, ATPase, and Fis domain
MELGAYADLSPDKTLEIILASIGELVDYELAVVLGYDGAGRLSVRKSMGPLAGPRIEAFSLSLAERPDLARILESGKPRLFAEDEEHLDTYAELLDLPEGHSCLAAPIVAGDQAIGLLTLDNRRCGVFTKEILRFIEVISKLIAVALSQTERSAALKATNARLVEERNRLLELNAEAFGNLAGHSPAWLAALDSLKLVAATDSPVLLLGETGTGKEESARALHRLSPRAAGPFVALNCSAMPASLAESELFGHEKGSFTGAQALRRGRFELASGGTLFLDEIGDLPLEIQPKLLRALQEGRFERVGGEKPVSVDLRIVAATHVDLGAAVREGRFREDLFYRVSVFPIRLPPLREREGDAVAIAGLFLERLRARPGWEGLRLTEEALDLVAARPWPGNVRELRNAVERAAILARGGAIGAKELGGGGLPKAGSGDDSLDTASWLEGPAAARGGSAAEARGAAATTAEVLTLEEAERRAIEAALARSEGKVYGADGAAAALGLPPSTLQSRMKRLGIAGRRGAREV